MAMSEYDDLVARLRALGSRPVDPAVASEHLTAMAAVRAGRARPAGRFQRLKVGAAFAAGIVLGGTSLASAGVMGQAVQDKVADAAQHVNVNLPGGTERSTVGCPAGKTYKNHGQFVKDGGDPKAPCGKPVKSVDKAQNGADDNGPDANGSGNGSACKPPWAGKMTKAERDAARAGADAWRAAHPECAADDQGENGNEQGDVEKNDENPSSTAPSSTAAVTPPGGGKDDNAGVPDGGSVPGSDEQGSEHRTDGADTKGGAPSTLPPQAKGNGADNGVRGNATTTTPLP